MRRKTGPPAEIREVVYARDGGRCVVCGTADKLQVHHRRPRGMGGSRLDDTNSPVNLLTVCMYDHAAIERQRGSALTLGWLVPQSQDPAETAVLVDRGSRWVYLTADGSYAEDPGVAA